MAWQHAAPNRPEDLRRALRESYPDLTLTLQGEAGLLRGSFPVVHEGIELDRFQVEVRIPADFPREIPATFETAQRIPVDNDWHTFGSGQLCVVVPEEWLMNQHSGSIMAYLDGPLRNYFISHALAEAGLPRPMGERSHGPKGLLEAYAEMVGASETAEIVRLLKYAAADKLKLHWPCPCGSGRRVCICHLSKVVELRKRLPGWIARKAIERLPVALTRPTRQAN